MESGQARMSVKSLLEKPALYELFSRVVGARSSRETFVGNYVRPRPGDQVLDVGCGPADILEHLPGVDYFGFDISPSYIESATRRYGDRGRFFCERVSEARAFLDREGRFDIVLAIGILHHLDRDEALDLFRLARRALKPQGRLVTLDPCYAPGQSPVARYLASRDRGRFVRDEPEYRALALAEFPGVTSTVRHDLLRMPYTHIILECAK
jgi:SAM-dependent methyltransferase